LPTLRAPEIQERIAQCRQDLRGIPFPDLTGIFAQEDVPHSMHPMLNRPMLAPQLSWLKTSSHCNATGGKTWIG
jgi:hypothetical protein